jgi:nicotinamidase-related amidase
MSIMKRLVPDRTLVAVIDVQERLAPAMPEARLRDVIRSAKILVEGARALGGKILATEQYPKGLGHTIAPIAELLQRAEVPRFEKVAFSACGADTFNEALRATNPEAIVLIGMETHVCVFQTVRDLTEQGFTVHVPCDGVSSRRDDHRDAGLRLCERAGAIVTTSETVLFDWMTCAGPAEFKQLSALVR